jgi:uncharacterized protein YodC (DUF2158 family)
VGVKFELGAVVRLASGGPAMTVTSDRKIGDTQECRWHASDGGVYIVDMPIAALVPATKPNRCVGFGASG